MNTLAVHFKSHEIEKHVFHSNVIFLPWFYLFYALKLIFMLFYFFMCILTFLKLWSRIFSLYQCLIVFYGCFKLIIFFFDL